MSFLSGVFPERGEAAIRAKIETEFRRWRRTEPDPMPELNQVRLALFRPLLNTDVVDARQHENIVNGSGALMGGSDADHDEDGDDGDEGEGEEEGSRNKGMAEPWGEPETRLFLELLRDFQGQRPHQRRIDVHTLSCNDT